MKKVFYSFIALVFFYAIWSFVTMKSDPRMWSFDARFLFCLFYISCVFILCMWRKI